VRLVFGDKEIGGNGGKSDEYPFDPGFHSVAAVRLMPVVMVHKSLLLA
jgi:hypothetical protein